MHFYNSGILLLLILVPVLALYFFFVLRNTAARLRILGESTLIERISTSNTDLKKVKSALIVLSVFFLLLALARPQFGSKLVEVNQAGADIVILVDTSASMLAADLKPSRMEKAKELLSGIIQQLGGNRIGIIAFAGTAFWQCPLTSDISSVNLFLKIMDANLIPLPGTSIGKAILLADKALEKTAPKSKAIVLLTDGEDHENDPLKAVSEAAAQGIKIFTIGFGNPSGEPIPMYDDQGNLKGYKKDKNGDVVMTRLDEALLMRISADTQGEYYKASDGNVDVSSLIDRLQNLEKRKTQGQFNRQYEDQYQYPLFAGLLLLIIEFLLPETKKRPLNGKI